MGTSDVKPVELVRAEKSCLLAQCSRANGRGYINYQPYLFTPLLILLLLCHAAAAACSFCCIARFSVLSPLCCHRSYCMLSLHLFELSCLFLKPWLSECFSASTITPASTRGLCFSRGGGGGGGHVVTPCYSGGLATNMLKKTAKNM